MHALSEGGIFIVRTISIVRSVVYRYIVASNAVTTISIKKLVIEHLLVHIEQVGFGGLVFRVNDILSNHSLHEIGTYFKVFISVNLDDITLI